MEQTELSLDEVTVLVVVHRELPIHEAAEEAAELWPCTKFDAVVARATIKNLLERGFLYEDVGRIGPTLAGRKVLRKSLEVLNTIRDAACHVH